MEIATDSTARIAADILIAALERKALAPRGDTAAYLKGTEGLAIDSRSGPCCEAVLSGEPVSVPDLPHDLRFPHFSELALPCGIQASWSTPIFSSRGKVVGTLVLGPRKLIRTLNASDGECR